MKQLSEFVNQEKYLEKNEEGNFVISDETLLSDAINYNIEKIYRIEGDVRKIIVETALIVNDTLDRLQALMANEDKDPNVRFLAKANHRALSKLYDVGYYINLKDEQVMKLYNQSVSLGVLNEKEAAAIIEASTYIEKPFANTKMEDIKAARYPTTWKQVNITSGNNQIVTPEGDLINATNNGSFRFKLIPASNFNGSINIRIFAKKADETEFSLQDSYPIVINKKWEGGMIYTNIFKRVVGLSGYRHFRFEYLEPFDNALQTIEVEGVN